MKPSKYKLSGKKLNFLEVLEPIKVITTNGNLWRWRCKCICGKIIVKTAYALIHGTATSCGCRKLNIGKKHKSYNGCEEITGDFVSKFRMGAKSRNLDFLINAEYMWNLWKDQNGICNLTGEKLTLPKVSRDRKCGNYTASLDRIDSSKGYIEGNVQWVHKDINRLKWDLSQDKLIELCEKIVKWKYQKNT